MSVKRIVKIASTFVLLICITAFLFLTRERTSPDFAVSDVKGEVIAETGTPSQFVLSFSVKNNGTAIATNVFGTAEFEQAGRLTRENCYFPQDVIEVDEEVIGCHAVFLDYSTSPSPFFLINITCAEAGPWEFNVTV